ncbi:SDR family oxidoreductase [Actinoplanes sp. NPDC049265]|uniref:SDR family oxidoreductase n=1 Tax=Actinoplanes sp. NPDC049265 TaxID=3363902 RepID=UPI0037175D23
MTTSTELVVVTGTSSGIGAATARELARRGFHVLAGARRPTEPSAGVEPITLDITSPDQVAALADRVAADGRPLRAVINNAGIGINGPVEALPMDAWRQQLEVNLFGQIAVTQALLPALLRGAGRVINISSVGGRVALPTYGAYAAAKFALEGLSDSLRREMAPHGVRVIVIQPGGVRTELTSHAIVTADRMIAALTPEQAVRYGRLIPAIVSHARAFTANGVSADRAAQVIAKAVTARRPRTRYTVGRDAAVLTRVSRVLPDRLLDRLLAADLRPHFRH